MRKFNLSGVSGVATVDSNSGVVVSWYIDITQDMVDITTLGSNGWKQSVPTLKLWTGNINVIFDTSVIKNKEMLTNADIISLNLEDKKAPKEGCIIDANIISDANDIIEISFNCKN